MEATLFKKLRKIGNSFMISIDPEVIEAMELEKGELIQVKLEKIKEVEKDESKINRV